MSINPRDIVKKGISRTFQNIRLFSDMRVIENVLVGAHIKTKYDLASSIFRTKKFREEEDAITYDALKVLREVGLYDRKDDYAQTCHMVIRESWKSPVRSLPAQS